MDQDGQIVPGTVGHEFNDILESGHIERTIAHKLESDEPDLQSLPRITLNFNRKKVGRLRQLVDLINDHA